ncbi:MAG TPA: hypothetical protein P5287_01095, partial [bacterium]|nr:hypothetical protein [bacterium]
IFIQILAKADLHEQKQSLLALLALDSRLLKFAEQYEKEIASAPPVSNPDPRISIEESAPAAVESSP